MSTGRRADQAVNWFCSYKIAEKLKSGELTQAKIAELTDVRPSAINLLLHGGQGGGLDTVSRLHTLLGYPTRGAMIDAADEWWRSGAGERYARATLDRKYLKARRDVIPRRKANVDAAATELETRMRAEQPTRAKKTTAKVSRRR